MAFVVVEPEASGRAAERSGGGPPAFVFDVWLGDDIVRAYPAVLVTQKLKVALAALPGGTGFRLARARVRSSRFRRVHDPERPLPAFWAVTVHGRPGHDDMGVTDAGALVVSRRVFDVLLDSRVTQAVFAQYSAAMPHRRPVGGGRLLT